MTLEGRHALITGAGRGLGAAIAERFVAEGASVLLCSRSMTPLAEVEARLRPRLRTGQTIEILRVDVSRTEDIDAAFARARDVFPRLDILANNAGIYGPMGSFESNGWKDWVTGIAVNLFGTAYTCKCAIPVMRQQGAGKIINLSGGGATNPLPNLSCYAASKAAVVRLTETLALELADAGIDVNCVAPGMLDTKMTEQALEAGPDRLGEAFIARLTKLRMEGATPLDVPAGLIAWLASSESDGVSGRLISAVWDPWRTLAEKRDELMSSDIYTLRRIVPQDRGKVWS
jgi:NAD(P)-dependent dehydrogenase (short-subunit alcohol dehydrogenase family)